MAFRRVANCRCASEIYMPNLLEVPQGRFQLKRLPRRTLEKLQAWDAADEYLLHYLADQELPAPNAQVTLLNDSFGALALALHDHHPIAISDSYLSRQATQINLQDNAISTHQVRFLDSLSIPDQAIDYLFIKVPKTLALLEYQLISLRPLLRPQTRIIAAGMVKTLPASVWTLMERLIGPTSTSLARKKARLIFAVVDAELKLPDNPYPQQYRLENTDFLISNHANVFSRESLDIGSRFLLQHLPDHPSYRRLIDLGCGNGVVGLLLAQRYQQADICFVDESYMAIDSARANFSRAYSGKRAEFLVNDGLSGFAPQSADCIVCNPPFHQQHAMGDQIAWQMFQQSYQVLRQAGELRVIGNRHLNYLFSLKKIFGNSEMVASNAKFVIVKAIKR